MKVCQLVHSVNIVHAMTHTILIVHQFSAGAQFESFPNILVKARYPHNQGDLISHVS